MNKLKSKVFYTIFLILTLSVLSFIVIFNIQKYVEKKSSINNSLNIATNNQNKQDFNNVPPEKPSNDLEMEKKDLVDENTKFMDFNIYTVLIDDNNEIKEIINHSNDELNSTSIERIATKILSSKNIKTRYIGCLYFNKFSYEYIYGDSLVILDNRDIKSSLLNSLYISILIFIVLEIIIFFISKLLTNWIIKPVKISFDKQKQFIADASHELKTPLSVIISSSEALEENPKENKWINNIKSESDRMNLLIKNLLDLASTDNKETFKLERNNLSKIIELSVLTFEGKAFENNIVLDYDIEDEIFMNLDENSIKELVEILLDNAIKHAYKKSTVKVTLKNSNNIIKLIVEDKGEEIPSGEEEKIFERFYRIDKSRNRKDGRYGLGLAIAKNIVINHNGKISAKSNNNITTFEVLFKK